MYQCVLRHETEDYQETIVVWLSDEKPFKVGDYITLKSSDDTERRWKVVIKDVSPIPVKDVKQTWTSQDIKRDGNRKKVL